MVGSVCDLVMCAGMGAKQLRIGEIQDERAANT